MSEVPKTLKNSGFCLDLVWIWPLLESFLDTFSAFSFFRASGTLKKGVRERVQKYTSFFVDFGVSPEGENDAPVYTGAQFSLLQLEPKRAPK